MECKGFWLPLKIDKAVDKVKDVNPYVRLRIALGKYGENDDMTVGGWDVKLTPPKLKQWTMYCHFYQGKALPPADEGGESDPYAKVYCGGAECKTEKKEDTLNPLYYETHEMIVEFDTIADAPPVIASVWDYDLTSDEILGRVIFNLEEEWITADLLKPAW
eukprot:CAMPEP_0201285856 /NCGR_PEP_ID=MMETSP1317-20130820/113928_1 /ASSEMBLY_ACC=CAM_ASM_000770 /TAXON_ID=187299 /ORGANISM="Undescribed Undescribed, Strain Undescribed" /LENGTH=160 /DNA_ID=CAMNT_0047611951 /DNA_START=1240 /DNA_END=1719 /DNA_ORIENTATION=+